MDKWFWKLYRYQSLTEVFISLFCWGVTFPWKQLVWCTQRTRAFGKCFYVREQETVPFTQKHKYFDGVATEGFQYWRAFNPKTQVLGKAHCRAHCRAHCCQRILKEKAITQIIIILNKNGHSSHPASPQVLRISLLETVFKRSADNYGWE